MSLPSLEQVLVHYEVEASSATLAGISFILAAASAVVLYALLGIVRQRLASRSYLKEVITAIRLPLVCLALLYWLAEYVGKLLVTNYKLSVNIDTLLELMLIGTFFWILLRYISGFETRLDKLASSQGMVKIALIGEELDRNSLQLIFKVLRAIIAVTIALMLLDAFGISITGLLAFGGVGGVVVGFAARGMITDVFSGMSIFWKRPFVVGDWIRSASNNVEGTVEAIGWQLTQIRTFDKRPLYVPNSLLTASVLENGQRMTNRRIYEHFGVRYSDIKKIPAILEDVRETLKAHSQIDKSQLVLANLARYGPSSVDFLVSAYTITTDWAEFHQAKEDILLGIAEAVHKNGADFAFPTRTVHLDPNTPHDGGQLA